MNSELRETGEIILRIRAYVNKKFIQFSPKYAIIKALYV